jgi:hypothetical protein
MRRLSLLVALSFAAIAPAAHAAPVAHGGATAHAAQAGSLPGDRDGDGTPDASDQCPDTPGGYQGCPPPPDRDGDGVPDATDLCPDQPNGNVEFKGCPQASVDRDNDGVWDTADACPDTRGTLPNGCEPFEWRYFFDTQGLKQFLADKPGDTVWCRGQTKCTTTHVTFTLSAATAKAAHITNRRISTIAVAVPTTRFDHNLSRATKRKLGRLKAITVTIRAWVVLETGKTIEAPSKTLTIRNDHFTAHQFNNLGTQGPEGGL